LKCFARALALAEKLEGSLEVAFFSQCHGRNAYKQSPLPLYLQRKKDISLYLIGSPIEYSPFSL
jgi:hypothetical protein